LKPSMVTPQHSKLPRKHRLSNNNRRQSLNQLLKTPSNNLPQHNSNKPNPFRTHNHRTIPPLGRIQTPCLEIRLRNHTVAQPSREAMICILNRHYPKNKENLESWTDDKLFAAYRQGITNGAIPYDLSKGYLGGACPTPVPPPPPPKTNANPTSKPAQTYKNSGDYFSKRVEAIRPKN